jgi:hypothetical protein
MKTNNFSLDVLETHRAFYLLDKLPKFSDDVVAYVSTGKGNEEVDFVDFFKMADGSILAAWKHPTEKLGLQNLVVEADGQSQILNLYPVERVLNILNKKLSSTNGVFYFSPSREIANGDWRCDRGAFGVRPFEQDFPLPVLSNVSQVVVYESFFSVAGVGHIFYIEFTHEEFVLKEKFENLIVPVAGKTLQEVLRLVWEWKLFYGKPFYADDEAAVLADSFWRFMQLTEMEIQVLDSLPPMHIHNFLHGSTNARTQPNNLEETRAETIEIVASRLAASSLSWIVSRNPELWTLDEILVKENIELENGVVRFRDYYEIPDSVALSDEKRIQKYAAIFHPNEGPYVHNQLNGFRNKRFVLDAVANGRNVFGV